MFKTEPKNKNLSNLPGYMGPLGDDILDDGKLVMGDDFNGDFG